MLHLWYIFNRVQFRVEVKIDRVCRSMLESDLENHQAQLSRFQLHVTSVSEQIVSMESQLNSTIMTLKKTLVSEPGSRKWV